MKNLAFAALLPLLAVPGLAEVKAIPPVKTGAMTLFASPHAITIPALVDAKIALAPAGAPMPLAHVQELVNYGQLVGMMSGHSPVVAVTDGELIGFVTARPSELPYAGFARAATPRLASFGAMSVRQLQAVHDAINAGDAVAAMTLIRDLFPK